MRDRQFFFILLLAAVLVAFVIVRYNGTGATEGKFSKWSLCQANESQLCPKADRNFPSTFVSAAPAFPVTACLIERDLSSFLSAAICFLRNPVRFLSANRSMNTGRFENRFCLGLNEFESLAAAERNDNRSNTLIAIVRDPLQRFIASYVDKCMMGRSNPTGGDVCYKCQPGDILCFLNIQYQRIMGFSKGLLQTYQLGYYDRFFFPQSWFCGFSGQLHKYNILKYESTAAEVHQLSDSFQLVLSSAGVPSVNTNLIAKQLQSGWRSYDSPEHSQISALIYSSDTLLAILTRLYYHDFVLFGIPFPQSPVERIILPAVPF